MLNYYSLGLQPLSFQTLEITEATVARLTVPDKATAALLQLDTDQSVRFTLNGATDPTASIGILLVDEEKIWIYGHNALFLAKFIETTAGTSVLQVQYFKNDENQK